MKTSHITLASAVIIASLAPGAFSAKAQTLENRLIVISNESGQTKQQQQQQQQQDQKPTMRLPEIGANTASDADTQQTPNRLPEISSEQTISLIPIETIKKLLDDPSNAQIGLSNLNNNIEIFEDAASYNLLGDLYRYGKGKLVKKDIREAIKNYQKAAQKGNADAACSLGFIYLSGEGGAENINDGIKYMRQAADANPGNDVAQFNVGYMYENGLYNVPKDEKRAFAYYQKSARQKNSDAICALGLFYYNGKGGCIQDKAKGVKLLKEAADAGVVDAYTTLGQAYMNGDGAPKDLLQGIHYLKLGADEGDPTAFFYLGFCYENGFGTTKDLKKALNYYQKAAEQNIKGASEKVTELSSRIQNNKNTPAKKKSKTQEAIRNYFDR